MEKMTIFDSTPAFGIDLGTTNSCIAVIGNGNRPTILPIDKKITLPSCVMWKGGNEFIVGEEAYKNRGRKNVIYSVKRLMGSGRKVKLEYNDMVREFEPWEISREILVALVTKAKQGIYKDIRDVVITVPAYFTNTQIEETKKAGEAANLNILCIMKEPTAAALLYNQEFSSKEPKKVLLYDLGGGTFDASVVLISSTQDSSLDDIYGLSSGNEKVLFSVLKVLGDTHLGGDDIDKELVHHLINHLLSQGVNLEDISSYTRELLLLKAEYYKKLGIGTYQESITINGKEVQLILKSEDFIKATEIVYKKTRFLVQQVLSDPIVGGNIDQIITVGGSTKSELIQSWLKYDFPEIVINTSMNPDESVALGAAIQAKRSKFGNDSITILDCLAMNIGVLSSGYITSILSAGDQIPCSNFKLFTTMEKGQKQVALDVYQGLTRFPEECTYLGTLEFNDLQVDEDKLARIVITLLVDSNGLLSIEAEIPGTGMRKLELVNVNGASKKNIDDKKLVRWRRFAKTLNEEDRESLLNMISRFSEGSLEEKEIVSFIQKHKKAIV